MSSRTRKFRRLTTARRMIPAWAGPAAALLLATARIPANPQGMTVAGGTVSSVANGNNLDITASHNAVINWSSFNIGAGETTTFHQPSAVSVVWNRIADTSPSQIWGNLNANGIVVLMNQSGFYFGPNSSINVGGFIATTAPINPPLPAGAPVWSQPASPPLASIVNYGSINVANGGSLFLVAEKILNHGVLTAPDGTLGLYAGKDVLVSERPDGRGLSANVSLPDGSVDNLGKLVADGGQIAVHARVVNQDGIIQANSIRNHHGVIELVAGDQVDLGADSRIQANGDATGMSGAGSVSIKSAGQFSDATGSQIEVRGGNAGGNGGTTEISATTLGDVRSHVDGAARTGFSGGRMLLDPYDLTLDGGSLNAYSGFSQILLQATHDIDVSGNTTLNLAGSTGVTMPGSLFTLQAGNNITLEDGARIRGGSGWSVALMAGVDFSGSTPVVQSGVGGIYLGNGSGIETSDGNITLQAGHEAQLTSSYVRTTGGGNIAITTGDGDVNAGTDSDMYDFSGDGYDISQQGIGGIGTSGGGNVTIQAGNDILAYNSAIGAFGAEAGGVSLTAARDVQGRFLVRNGTGIINAGRDDGNDGNGISLGLISGGWDVTAARNLFVNEVYNPNGAQNPNNASYGAGVPFQYDYAPDASVTLKAPNGGVSLQGNNLIYADNNDDSGRPPIYPPVVTIAAGAGGVTLGNDLVLCPSAQGLLKITTSDDGPLQSAANQYYQILMSDSDNADYHTFVNSHAATPLHLGQDGFTINGQSGYAMDLDIAGNLENLFIGSPAAAYIHVHGDVPSMGFQGQNLSASDQTVVTIDGNYSSRSQNGTTSVNLSDNAQAAFDQIFNLAKNPNQVIDTGLAERMSYDPVTKKLSLRGPISQQDLQFLLNPTYYKWDAQHGYALDANGNREIFSEPLTADTTDLQKLYNDALANIPASAHADDGLQVDGPGRFKVSAASMDLGISHGIVADGPFGNTFLKSISLHSADIDLTLTGAGGLSMTSSKVASLSGGNVHIDSAGPITVGSSSDALTSDSTVRGIYTDGGDISVFATGKIDVEGSRIAAFNGSNVTVLSGVPHTQKDDSPISWDQVVLGPNNILYVIDPSGPPIYDKLKTDAKGRVIFDANDHKQFDTTHGTVITDANGPVHGYLVQVTGGEVDAGSGGLGFAFLPFFKADGSVDNAQVFGSGILALTNPREPNSHTLVGDINIVAGGDVNAGTGGGVLQLAFNNYDQSGAQLNVLSDAGSINAGQSGMLGRNLDVTATRGSINGIFVAAGNADIHAQNNVDVTAIAGGNASVSGGGTISGSIVGGTGATVAGSDISASVISTSGNASANGSSSSGSAFAGVAAPTTQKSTDDASTTVANKSLAEDEGDDDPKKKKRGKPGIGHRVSRVTVILPNRKQP